MLASGCTGLLKVIVGNSKVEKAKVEDVPSFEDFLEVFPKDLPSLPPEREIKFKIELAPGTNPIFKAPYGMTPVELKELHAQLKVFLDKGFI